MQEPKNDKVNSKGTVSAESSVEGRLSIATSYSPQHIQSATLFSRLSFNIEKNHVHNPSEELKAKHKAYVTAAIFTAVSFLESTINELFWEMLENPKKFEALNSETIDIIASMWKQGVQKTSTLEKYQFALALARRSLFDKGALPYQDVFILTKVRNALIHFEPEWVADKPQKLEESLKGKFKLSPFFWEGSLFFPHKCLSHGCAKWAVTSSLKFTDDFFARMSLKPKYDHLRSKLKTE